MLVLLLLSFFQKSFEEWDHTSSVTSDPFRSTDAVGDVERQ